MDLLLELREVKQDLDEVLTDRLGNTEAFKLNRAKNKLAEIVYDGERRETQKRLKTVNPNGNAVPRNPDSWAAAISSRVQVS